MSSSDMSLAGKRATETGSSEKVSIDMGTRVWNLLADIGGTNARFGLEDCASRKLQLVKHYSVSEYVEFSQALNHFLDDVSGVDEWQLLPRQACLAVACPVERDIVQFTNSPWVIDKLKVSTQLKEINVELINDFTAVAYAITTLTPGDWSEIGGVAVESDRPIAVLGPGTGLGVCSLVPVKSGYQVIEGEGGHVDFAPVDSQEIAVLEILRGRFGRVSAERLLSGAGIMNIYQALAQLDHQDLLRQTPAEVTQAALSGVDSLSVKTLEMFCRILGSVAGNLALTLGAKGGVYIAGGILPQCFDFLKNSEFRSRFEAKGRFRSYLTNIPVRVIQKQNLGLVGAARYLN